MKILTLNIGGQDFNPPSGIPTGGLSDHKAQGFLNHSLTIMLLVAVILALFALLFSGFQWMTSGGDAKLIEAARRRIFYVIIGLVIIFLSFAIIAFIGNFFNIPFLSL